MAVVRRSLRPPWLGRTVGALAAVSLLTDLSSEMIYPLLPLFLTGTLGASAATLGVIEGAAESTAALLRLGSGWWSDRLRRRKPLVVAGYALAGVARPLVAIATTATQVLAVRLVDRLGKGVRSAPRDALLADAAPAGVRGRVFGFHRAADHLGAVLGPLVAFVLLGAGSGTGLPLRTVFWLAAVPGAVAVLVLVFGVRERTPAARADDGLLDVPPVGEVPGGLGGALGRDVRGLLAAVVLFTLGNSTDAFLLLRAAQLGVPTAIVPVLWAALHLVKAVASTPGGALSDRFGRRPVIVAGWMLYALVYLGFAHATTAVHAWTLFGAYGLYFALTEGAEKALVADLAPVRVRGAAFGWYHLAVGVAALPASWLFGLLWDARGPAAAFTAGAGLALAASAALVLLVGPPARRAA